jgi:hypothetical protein
MLVEMGAVALGRKLEFVGLGAKAFVAGTIATCITGAVVALNI